MQSSGLNCCFARNFGLESSFQAAVQAAAILLMATFSPAIAIGMQLVNQVVGTPVSTVGQALSSSFGRSIRSGMQRGTIDSTLLTVWTVIMLSGTAASALLVAFPFSNAMLNLFGENWTYVNGVLFPICLYIGGNFIIQIYTLPTRWWIDSNVVRNWISLGYCGFYLGIAFVSLYAQSGVFFSAVSVLILTIMGARTVYAYLKRPKGFQWS